uniref:Uncharacterized protein n=1 Tax=Mycena chlorophos TaxID=658473 RepID=A0ABQ0MCK2_MYCCL|nr:predicted protein [Mycena chlorophos]
MHVRLETQLKADFADLFHPADSDSPRKLRVANGWEQLLRRACETLRSREGHLGTGFRFPGSIRTSNGGRLQVYKRRPVAAEPLPASVDRDDLLFGLAEESGRLCESCGEDGDGRVWTCAWSMERRICGGWMRSNEAIRSSRPSPWTQVLRHDDDDALQNEPNRFRRTPFPSSSTDTTPSYAVSGARVMSSLNPDDAGHYGGDTIAGDTEHSDRGVVRTRQDLAMSGGNSELPVAMIASAFGSAILPHCYGPTKSAASRPLAALDAAFRSEMCRG